MNTATDGQNTVKPFDNFIIVEPVTSKTIVTARINQGIGDRSLMEACVGKSWRGTNVSNARTLASH